MSTTTDTKNDLGAAATDSEVQKNPNPHEGDLMTDSTRHEASLNVNPLIDEMHRYGAQTIGDLMDKKRQEAIDNATDAQLDGTACIKCGRDLQTTGAVPVSHGPRGQLFACSACYGPRESSTD